LIDLALDARRVRYAPPSKASPDILTRLAVVGVVFRPQNGKKRRLAVQTVASLSISKL
jgi:hypothetical protein